MTTLNPSIFTRIVRGEVPAAIVFEDDHTIAFMDAGQVNEGHVLVATKKQVETIVELDDEILAALIRAVARAARLIERAYSPEGITILQANRPAGWQTVPHCHFHVVPRFSGDGVELTWPRTNPHAAALHEAADRLRSVLEPGQLR